MTAGGLHHVEIWVPDMTRAEHSWGWLLGELGWTEFQHWPNGRSWRLGPTYLVMERSPDLSADTHDRRRPGLNHLAFHVASTTEVDRLTGDSADRGWTLLYPDRHPHAGGEHQYAAYLADRDGYEAELVAMPPPGDRLSARDRSTVPLP